MARPRKSAPTRDALVQLGMRLFAAQGFHGTGLKQILDEAAVPKGSFYNYFQSKEHFAVEVIDAYSARLLSFIDGVDGDDPAIRLIEIHRQLLAIVADEETPAMCLLGGIAAETGAQFGDLQCAIKSGFETWVSKYAEIFAEAWSATELNGLSANQAARLFINQWQGSMQRFQFDQNEATVMKDMRAIVNLLIPNQGLKPSVDKK